MMLLSGIFESLIRYVWHF